MSTSEQRRNGGPAHDEQYALEQPFDNDSLVALRSAVAAHADMLGLDEARVSDLVLVAHELASNAVRHGGGSGRLRLWASDGTLCCQVSDKGNGFDYPRPDEHRRPPLGATGGRGLWIAARLADVLELSTGPGGTVATVRIRLH
jgi:anti-sigma regulatory factor (Ser/Thr protein kinase)